jgi:hypothetical protein
MHELRVYFRIARFLALKPTISAMPSPFTSASIRGY